MSFDVVVGLTSDCEPKEAGASAGRYFLRSSYVDAVLRAGGLPVILPHAADLGAVASFMNLIDALVVTGGAFDVPAELYGEQPGLGMGGLKVDRTTFELAILRRALDARMPVLAVCGGMQLLNVVYGGTLHQDIALEVPEALEHEQKTLATQPSHEIDLFPGSILASCAGGADTMAVNSTHHQAVKNLGRGLLVSGRSRDGVIEAIEDPSRPFVVGVQWHPELLADANKSQQSLYDRLVECV